MEILTDWRWMIAPFLACLILSVSHVYMGVHIVARKVIFVDLALAQIAAVGATYATTLGYDVHHPEDVFAIALFSLAFTVVGAGVITVARMRKEQVPQEAFIGIVYVAASAAAVLILSKSPTGGAELQHMLVGDILLVSLPTIANVTLIYAVVGVFHVVFRRRFFAVSLDLPGAEAAGVNVRLWDFLFYMTMGILVTQSVAIAGVLLVFSYLVIPAVIGQMWFATMSGRLLMGWFVAVLASITGILWSFYSDYPTGPTVVMALTSFLILSGLAYFVHRAENRSKAVGWVSLMLVSAVVFFSTLSEFRKVVAQPPDGLDSPAAILLDELVNGDISGRLDAISLLVDVDDPRVVPALAGLLGETSSEQVVEAIAWVFSNRGDPRAAPALWKAVEQDYDPFLELSIAEALVACGDNAGYRVMLEILRDEEAGFARAQAIERVAEAAGDDFGYQSELGVEQNRSALEAIDAWINGPNQTPDSSAPAPGG